MHNKNSSLDTVSKDVVYSITDKNENHLTIRKNPVVHLKNSYKIVIMLIIKPSTKVHNEVIIILPSSVFQEICKHPE